ncbi:transcriptional regulator with XRE-family HTH domain [Caldanaerobacter subterraneus subsp. tengcongensis MB4]|uniref:Predicted Transcriptional regulator n=1 Tax=Caldanaerobacter subterraneus subsp. tengcongensis (strain DSM 15242 / JCM 11007 / NBRC 100824 / MB4) TaxID=273068 RepID=Q8R5Q9_CALS4|nr:helix-turn-helix transcriptional regulator [Caldanaerobacter subterraneus]AAM25221.1 predicted Transcriptional regulator [Caldanaerobacter subterraneus subsp. tengcongensis MB4]MCS3915182.1 transcriptional regulator with XRE-family HTH domain [Caldanaerobacter subterraneus subsp. tengcongensis MB4]
MKEEVYREIGRRLWELRRQRGFTREQAARYLGISQKQLARYEKGREKISTDVLERLAGLYGCDYKYLLDDNESSSEQIAVNFGTYKISDEDLEVIAFANQFVMNLNTMYNMDEELKMNHNLTNISSI